MGFSGGAKSSHIVAAFNSGLLSGETLTFLPVFKDFFLHDCPSVTYPHFNSIFLWELQKLYKTTRTFFIYSFMYNFKHHYCPPTTFFALDKRIKFSAVKCRAALLVEEAQCVCMLYSMMDCSIADQQPFCQIL